LKKLFDILPVGFQVEIIGRQDIDIAGISIDSRQIESGFAYAAFKGTLVDGHHFIDKAIQNGASCIICESAQIYLEGVTYIILKDVRSFVGELVHNYYNLTDSDG
jgi:UDP-N-acetylmuramoyl-L-alanyl-D-glutamate--2,6-diaminopimelate ligase